MSKLGRSLPFCLVVAMALLVCAPVFGQTPSRGPITIVVPYLPGGPTDLAARVIGESMAATLGQSVVIENVSGGSGTIATTRVGRAVADGNTLLMHQVAIAANVTLLPKAAADTEKELTGVGLVNFSPLILLGRKGLPANSMDELRSWVKERGSEVRFSHPGSGSLGHLCGALVAQSVNSPVTMIPYRGGTAALMDLVAGNADLYCSTPSTGLELIKSGAIKAFGITSEQPLASLPGVPSALMPGDKTLDIRYWQGLFAPAATPKPVLERLNGALRVALADPRVIKSFADRDMSIFPASEQTPEAANKMLHDEIRRWGEVIRANKIQ